MRWWMVLRRLLTGRCAPGHAEADWAQIAARRAELDREIAELERLVAVRRVERGGLGWRQERRRGPH